MTIANARSGASFAVTRILSGGEVGKRLADMGFTQGAEGAVVRSGFLRGPVHVRIRGYDLILRRSEAERIEVEPVGDWTADLHGSGRFGRKSGESDGS
jgi:Fe2+ transport system protein FeoA